MSQRVKLERVVRQKKRERKRGLGAARTKQTKKGIAGGIPDPSLRLRLKFGKSDRQRRNRARKLEAGKLPRAGKGRFSPKKVVGKGSL